MGISTHSLMNIFLYSLDTGNERVQALDYYGFLHIVFERCNVAPQFPVKPQRIAKTQSMMSILRSSIDNSLVSEICRHQSKDG